MLNTGETAPDFALQDQSGATLSLEQVAAKGDLILYFYPVDFSPVCTGQACAFRDSYADIQSIGTQIIGISPQSVASHQRFADLHNLPFPLLSDVRKQVIRAYGVDGPLGFGVRRATFLIGQDRIVRNRVVSDLFLGSHTDLLKATLNGGGAA